MLYYQGMIGETNHWLNTQDKPFKVVTRFFLTVFCFCFFFAFGKKWNTFIVTGIEKVFGGINLLKALFIFLPIPPSVEVPESFLKPHLRRIKEKWIKTDNNQLTKLWFHLTFISIYLNNFLLHWPFIFSLGRHLS